MATWRSLRFFGLGAALCGLALVFSACQAPLTQGGRDLSFRLQLESAVPGLLETLGVGQSLGGSRFLTADAKTVHVSISRANSSGSAYYDQDSPVGTNAAGKPSVSIAAPGIPLGIQLDIKVDVKDVTGTILMAASQPMTFKTDGANTATLTLVPTADCPNMFNLDTAPAVNLLSIPGKSSRIVSMTIKDSQKSVAQRLAWDRLAAGMTVKIWDAAGAEIANSLVLSGREGTVFTPAATGVVYATVSNPADTPVSLLNLNIRANLTQASVSLGSPLSRQVLFSIANASVTRGDSLTVVNAATNPAGLTGWAWTVDGVADTGQTGAGFSWATAGVALGNHVIGVSVTSDGILYSGSLTVMVVAAAAGPTWTITYSSQGADSGNPPVDPTSWADGAAATVQGGGSLGRNGLACIGWTLSAKGVGTIYTSGSPYTITANTTLYPVWGSTRAGAFRLVPGGTFRRASFPAYTSQVSSFFMGRTPVTRAQWQAVMGAGSDPSVASASSATDSGQNDPVQNVSWYQAIVFCNTLSLAEGLVPVYSIGGLRNPSDWGLVPTSSPNSAWDTAIADHNANGYRLPTEAEWVWAAMGGLSDGLASNLSGGINVNGYQKCYAGSTEAGSGIIYRGKFAWYAANTATTQPVAKKFPNELGLYDMSGNVFQWCWDINNQQDSTPYLALPITCPVTDYTGSGAGLYRVSHGGSYLSSFTPDLVVAGGRHSEQAARQASDTGFRLARGIPGTRYLPRGGLVAEMLMNDYWADTSGSGINYSWANSPTKLNDRHGIPNYALSFSSGAQVLYNPSAAFQYHSGASFSLSAWLNIDTLATSSYPLIMQGTGVGQFQYGVYRKDATTLTGRIGENGNWSNGVMLDTGFTAGTWFHVVLVWDAATQLCSLYTNGQFVNTGKFTGNLATPPGGQFRVGADGCTVDDLRIYNRALDYAEIQQLYQE
jgi:formylglycine-generating enzyme required for sulfatase activity